MAFASGEFNDNSVASGCETPGSDLIFDRQGACDLAREHGANAEDAQDIATDVWLLSGFVRHFSSESQLREHVIENGVLKPDQFTLAYGILEQMLGDKPMQPELARPMGSVAARKEIAVPEVSEPVRMVAPPRNRPRTNHYQASSDASPSTTSSPSGADGLWKDVSPRDDELVWQGKALCATADPDIFFPEKGASPREAKEICGRCEVTTECLRYAVENDEWFGIWGRHTARERRKYKKSRLP
jgi:WhiB family transcriptional regulator, redox-sensing transcriptional regulator